MSLNDRSTPPSAGEPALPLLVVAAALFDRDGRVLMQQRPMRKAHGGLWEFPGGKVEPGETPQQALVRELFEELGIRVAANDLSPVTFASHSAGLGNVILLLFACDRWQGEVQALEAKALCWDRPTRLARLPMPPLDVPLVAHLARR